MTVESATPIAAALDGYPSSAVPRTFFAGPPPRAPIMRAAAGGHHHENAVEVRDGTRVVVRRQRPGARSMDLRRIPEAETLRHLEMCGFPAPRVLDVAPDHVVLSFVEGRILHETHPRSAPLPAWVAHEAARLLRSLHELDGAALARWCADLAPPGDARALHGSLTRFARDLHARHRDALADALARLHVPDAPFDDVERMRDALASAPFALCHLDAHRRNLLVQEGEWLALLDWELALVADPAYDVALHLHRMRYAPAQEEAFLQAYAGGRDVGALRAQVAPYRALECVRAAIGDLVRLVDDLGRGPSEAEARALAQHYAGKLARAREVWGQRARADADEVLAAAQRDV